MLEIANRTYDLLCKSIDQKKKAFNQWKDGAPITIINHHFGAAFHEIEQSPYFPLLDDLNHFMEIGKYSHWSSVNRSKMIPRIAQWGRFLEFFH